ncbi:hypothetical protein PPGU19_012140 [Paraburkholderia sp. PGU19]|uniref:hypothetical protein n=1 Tax=Paraburkholderia sp. PGU19 TaxID=2735434 RepID=UPI0015DB1127|nr:hypothetical protein [Paraburkholderia sp. PGU19]BCF96645.1 hypothetical protein PPGU19_012140 [Paraburkholderia sp. PGU19]
MGQKFAAYDAQGNITAYYDAIDSPVPSGVTSTLEITDAQWQACISTQGYKIQGGALVAPSTTQIAAQQAAATWATYQANAKALLDASDITVLRCIENGVTMPPEWATYRKSLRSIVGAASGNPGQPLPTRPQFPAGT